MSPRPTPRPTPRQTAGRPAALPPLGGRFGLASPMIPPMKDSDRQLVALAIARQIEDCGIRFAQTSKPAGTPLPSPFTPYRGLKTRTALRDFCQKVGATESQVRAGQFDQQLWLYLYGGQR